MSTNDRDRITDSRDQLMLPGTEHIPEFSGGVWEEEYPSRVYDRDAVMREVDERIREYIYTPSASGNFLNSSVPFEKIRGPVIRISVAINHGGPLTQSGGFKKIESDTSILLLTGGSGYSTVGGQFIGFNCAVDGLIWGGSTMFANPANTHLLTNAQPMLFPANEVSGFDTPLLSTGNHTVSFTNAGNNVSDSNDSYWCWVFEFRGATVPRPV